MDEREDEMTSRKGSYTTTSKKTLSKWEAMVKEWYGECLSVANHERLWCRDELESRLASILDEDEKSHLNSWWNKLCFASVNMDVALDVDLSIHEGPKYYWRTDGQIPTGMLLQRLQIMTGILPSILDFVWAMAKDFSSTELKEKLGRHALLAIVLARLQVHQLFDGEQKDAALAQLAELENEVAKEFGSIDLVALYGDMFRALLPPPAETPVETA